MHANYNVHLTYNATCTFDDGTACAADVGTISQIQHSVCRWEVTINHARMYEIFKECPRVFPTVEYDLVFRIVIE